MFYNFLIASSDAIAMEGLFEVSIGFLLLVKFFRGGKNYRNQIMELSYISLTFSADDDKFYFYIVISNT